MYTTVGAFLNIKEVRDMKKENRNYETPCIREATYEEVKALLENQVKGLIMNHAKYGKSQQEVAIDVTKLVAMAITEASKEATLN